MTSLSYRSCRGVQESINDVIILSLMSRCTGVHQWRHYLIAHVEVYRSPSMTSLSYRSCRGVQESINDVIILSLMSRCTQCVLYVIKFVSDSRQVGGFLWVLRFHPSIKLDRHDINEILLKMALTTITLTLNCQSTWYLCRNYTEHPYEWNWRFKIMNYKMHKYVIH